MAKEAFKNLKAALVKFGQKPKLTSAKPKTPLRAKPLQAIYDEVKHNPLSNPGKSSL
jgi:hypothetical protein